MAFKVSLRIAAAVFFLVAAALLLRTGQFGVAPGAVTPGAADPVSMAFWYQLSFVRLLAVAVAGMGAVALWGSDRLDSTQQRSLTVLVGAIAAALALMAAAQQWAIWNSVNGRLLTSVFAAVALACFAAGSRWARRLPRRWSVSAAR